MCGRYVRRSDKQHIAEAFKLGRLPEGFELPPDWNIASTTNQPIIRSDPETGERDMALMRWGTLAAWSSVVRLSLLITHLFFETAQVVD
jgi:putative SOS response-associated peptidase YedK